MGKNLSRKDPYKNFDFKQAEKLIRQALKEDIGKDDVTSCHFIPKDSISRAEILVKEDGIIAGLKIFEMVMKIVERSIKVSFKVKDGANVRKGQVIGLVSGNSRGILRGERVSLNLLQRMSGVATQTFKAVEALGDSRIKVIDTRKTTPNLRIFEKLAVVLGGGENHRFGLYDMILVKDNHIEANGGLENTIQKLKKIRRRTELKIEVEVKNMKEFELLIKEGAGYVDRVMLDNFSISDVKRAVASNTGNFEVEISGGVNLKNISKYRGIKGINYISMGSLTHTVDSMDISLNFL